MRQIACVFLAVACGCASMKQEARLRGRAEAVVAGALEADSPALRVQAARIAADVADPLLDRRLAARLGDRDPTVRATAAVALSRATPLAAGVLRDALDGADLQARVIAIDAIDTLSDAVPRLSALAAEADVRVRARVATALVQAKHPDARALLEKLLGDADAGVRGQALAGLAALGDRGAMTVIVQSLDDPSLGVRLSALGALVRLGRGEVGDRLLALAAPAKSGATGDRFVALRAAVQLSRAGRPTAALP
ncbi:MAG: putative phosphohydrolase, partial [Myxococcales bacterium]|nr:putative phosphohydrolase [Myxococcales bacterium]